MMASSARTTVAPMMLRGVKTLPGDSPAETVAMTGLAAVPEFWPMLGVPLLTMVVGMPGDVWLGIRLEAVAFEAARAALPLAISSAKTSSLVIGAAGSGGGSDSILGRTRSTRLPEYSSSQPFGPITSRIAMSLPWPGGRRARMFPHEAILNHVSFILTDRGFAEPPG